MTMAAPMPPPAHIDSTPMPPPRRRSFVDGRRDHAGAGGGDRVTQADAGAVDVDDLLVEAQLAGTRDGLGGECLVDLEQRDVLAACGRPMRAPSGWRRSGRCRCASAGRRPATTTGCTPALPGWCPELASATTAAASLVPDELPAVTLKPSISGCNTLRPARVSREVFRRGCSSSAKVTVDPRPAAPGSARSRRRRIRRRWP